MPVDDAPNPGAPSAVAPPRFTGAERGVRTLAAEAEILSSLATVRDIQQATSTITAIVRRIFAADHVALGVLDFDGLTPEAVAFDSDVLSRGDLLPRLSSADADAYKATVAAGAEIFDDLKKLDLNPGTALMRKAGLRSAIRAPFILSDGRAGVIAVARREPSSFNADDAHELAELCRVTGVALDRVRLINKLTATASLLAAQTRVLSALAPGATVEDVASVVVNEARGLFGASHAVVVMFEQGESEVVALSSEHLTREQLSGLNIVGTGNLDAFDALQRGRPHIVPDLEESTSGEIEQVARDAGLRCLMRAPILGSAGGLRGLISVGSGAPFAYTEADVAHLAELATVVSAVAERATLLEDAAERSARVSTLARMLGTLSATAAPEEAARVFAEHLLTLLHASTVVIYSFDAEAGTRTRIALAGDGRLAATRATKPMADSVSYQGILANRTALYDANHPESAPAWLRGHAERYGMQSGIAVRFDGSDGPAGMIAAGATIPGFFDRADLQMLGDVASPLAMVIERARIVTSLRQQTQRARAVVDILAALAPNDSLEAVSAPLARALRAMYNADHCVIGINEGEIIRITGQASAIDLSWLPASYRPGQLTAFQTAAGRGYEVVQDLRTSESHLSGPMVDGLRQRGLRSSMRVLLGEPGAPVGIVTVGSTAPGRFTERDAAELRQTTQPLAVAAGYFQSLREAGRRNRQLEHTNRILSRLGAGGTPAELAAGFLAECRSLFGCEHATALRFDPEAGLCHVLGMDSSVTSPEEIETTTPLDGIAVARMVDDPTPEFVTDARTLPQLSRFQDILVSRGLYSLVSVPLAHTGHVCGAVVLWGTGTGRFDESDARQLAALTSPFAVALERAEALDALAESENKYRSLVTQAEEMIFLFDAESRRILDANAYTARALGYSPEEVLALRLDDICDVPEEMVRANVQHIIEAGELRLSDHEYLRKDGSTVLVDIVAAPATVAGRRAVLVLARDITGIRGFQRQLMQTQKMESLGTMAGAVAHDFNNLLTTILGFAGLLKRSANLDEEDRENLGLIEDAARHAADLTGRLLAFARGGLVRFGPVDLRDAVRDTMRLAEPALHSNLKVAVSLPGEPVLVEGDQGQIQQAIINIVLNARDAMAEGGSITIELHASPAVATLTIADTGPGMSEETRTRIFEPFYTTKPTGSGTGLGMAITYGIVQGHHGTITVDTETGVGTTFIITLPLLPSDATHRDDAFFNAGEGDLILVVDDDEMVRRTTHATLAELGYSVVEARDGATAIQLLKARPERFAAVLLDLVMPGMTGSETYRGLEAIRPDLPVIVCTAYAADAHIDTDVKRRIAGLIQKPFTSERLARALAGVGAKSR